ncbi:MAG: lysine--tRNA ligase, partial [Candidatus Omnitrophota bacterium]
MEKEINELIKQRFAKLDALKQSGVDPYGHAFADITPIKDLVGQFEGEGQDPSGKAVIAAGRIMAMRLHGKSIFCDLRDQQAKIQLYIKADIVGKEQFDIIEKADIGDLAGIKGELFKTRTGEPTIKVLEFTLLAKSLRPLPEKWHGLKDVETRFRQRYVDLIVNENVKKIFYTRSGIVTRIRQYLDQRGYLEVETPMMHPIAGGAAGKPFKTHHETLDMDLFLRIAPELYLKKLLVGGLERVYEINRSFRNEGISPRHNPEFTMLEVYAAYSDCEGMMRLTEGMIRHLAREVLGKEALAYQGQDIDLTKWDRISFADLMKENFDISPEDDTKTWIDKLKKKGVKLEKDAVSRTQLLNITADLIEPKAKANPVFVVDLFAELCPLAKKKKDNPLLTDRFELFVGGMEIANAYSELNDPIEQKKRFMEQFELQDDKKAKKSIDEDFVRALEYGMPPA